MSSPASSAPPLPPDWESAPVDDSVIEPTVLEILLTVRAPPSASTTSPEVALVKFWKVGTALELLLNDAPPADEPVRTPAVIAAVSPAMSPVEVRVRVPVPMLTAPVTVRFWPSASKTFPLAVSLNGPNVPIALPGLVKDAPPTDDPVSVPAVRTPDAWPTEPDAIRATVPPAALRLAARISGPPPVEVRVRVFPDPASSAPLTVNPTARVSVIETFPAPVLVKPASVLKTLGAVRVAPPTEEPDSDPTAMTPPATWVIVPADVRTRLLLPFAPVIVLLIAIEPAALRVRLLAVFQLTGADTVMLPACPLFGEPTVVTTTLAAANWLFKVVLRSTEGDAEGVSVTGFAPLVVTLEVGVVAMVRSVGSSSSVPERADGAVRLANPA